MRREKVAGSSPVSVGCHRHWKRKGGEEDEEEEEVPTWH